MGIDAVYASADSDPAVQSALAVAWQTLSRFRIEVPQRNNLFVYFKCLDDVLAAVHDAGGIEAAEAAMGHVDYLADKAGCSSAVILGGMLFSADQQVILDALLNINNVLLETSQRRPEVPADGVMTEVPADAAVTARPADAVMTARPADAVMTARPADANMTARPADAVMTVDTAVVAAWPDIDPAVEGALARAWLTLSEFRIPDPERSRSEKQTRNRPTGRLKKRRWTKFRRSGSEGVPTSGDLFTYFRSLNEVLIVLDEVGAVDAVEAINANIEYLGDKAGCKPARILEGGQFVAQPQPVVDTLANIGYELRKASKKLTRHLARLFLKIPADADPAVQDALASAWQTLGGFRIQAPASTGLRDYFKSLHEVLTRLHASGGREPAEAAFDHIDYLAHKAGCRTRRILAGRHFTADPATITDVLVNIDVALREVPPDLRTKPPPGIPEDVFALIIEAETQLAGWCSREKALVIARSVLQLRPAVCVEIGIFGGRSLVPCAAALRHIGAGAIYGIEGWNASLAIANSTNELNDYWWSEVDFARVKREFYQFVAAMNLTPQVRLIESPSGRAAGVFDEIDFLHIDGSHSMLTAAEDVILYARKVRSGGIIMFDDVNWSSTAPARELLGGLCDTVQMLKHPESGRDICAVLRRR